MQLLIGNAALPIAQMGPDFLFIDEPIEHPPGEATIVFAVEGHDERCWKVWLPEGLALGRERVVIAKVG
ncbi:MAG: hypothetical protein ABI680_17620 [Chthoniobacteraceae bacterium]